MTTTEPTDEELREHLAAVQAMRDDFQRLWRGGLRHAFVTQEAAVWNAYRAGRTATICPLLATIYFPPPRRLTTNPDHSP